MPVKTNVKELKGNLIQKRIYEMLSAENNESTETQLKESICEEMEISQKQLTYWLNNSYNPDIYQLFKLAQVLKCTVNDLIH